ncbi:hypothetical protein BOTBODRAFT_256372 [Botryobasidium botryosum FD-172 SS1]|uniref:Uncharacterized protein n=1 Tax=Botryobasidium botryosum (strain FD-172 SS1) TaxID=930990 RepID=A0A067LTA6_BOTB1|nr:hypothetical protein BOTBODRAFT_256372 [Botryobasidium botryosum FD-172 SS1]
MLHFPESQSLPSLPFTTCLRLVGIRTQQAKHDRSRTTARAIEFCNRAMVTMCNRAQHCLRPNQNCSLPSTGPKYIKKPIFS